MRVFREEVDSVVTIGLVMLEVVIGDTMDLERGSLSRVLDQTIYRRIELVLMGLKVETQVKVVETGSLALLALVSTL